MKELFIYIHIPWCEQQCSYCDFATYKTNSLEDSKNYVSIVRKEIKNKSIFFKNFKVKTVYFGGGTPSLIPGEDIVSILKELKSQFVFDISPEITIEVNPGTLTKEKLHLYKAHQINRYSLGVQTFTPWFLNQSGRQHSVEDSLEDLKYFQENHSNFSMDLMFGLPKQTFKDFQKDVKTALNFNPPHISLYNLKIPPHHNLAQKRAPEEEQKKMFLWMETALSKKGLKKYEISNFAIKDRESLHNSAYWTGKNILGLGLSAHSHLQTLTGNFNTSTVYGVRFWNSRHLKTYTKQVQKICNRNPFDNLPSNQIEVLKMHEALTDFCHTRLRKKTGFSFKELFSLFPQETEQVLSLRLKELKAQKYIRKTNGFFHLTKKGEILSNLVFLQLTFLKKDLNFLNIPIIERSL